MSRGRLARYAPYQLWDYAVERGLMTLVLFSLLIGPQLYMLRILPDAALEGRDLATIARAALADMTTPLATVAVLFAVNGICSLDRQRGYFRFLFAKPVSVPAYYAQDFLVRGVGVAALSALAALVFALVSGTPFQAGFVAYVALVYALLGGLGFLISALVQLDGLLMVVAWAGSAILLSLHDRFPERVPTVVARALPPVDKFDAARDAWMGGGAALPAAHLWWVIGYGLACFALGLVALRRRPLAR